MQPCTINRLIIGGKAPVRLMGVLNASPESFFPASYVPSGRAHEAALAMVERGAEIIDVGARATGPGSSPITPALERERIQSVLKEIDGTCTLSVDTMHPLVLEAALKYEIHAVNDISGLAHPLMQKMVAESGLPAILMAARERPGDAGSVDAVKTALALVTDRCAVAEIDDYVLDPGIGLWTSERTAGDNWELCRRFSEFSLFNRPLLAAISRKSFLGDLLKKPVTERKYASIALNVLLMVQGAAMIRTHDVQETAEAIRVFQKMEGLP